MSRSSENGFFLGSPTESNGQENRKATRGLHRLAAMPVGSRLLSRFLFVSLWVSICLLVLDAFYPLNQTALSAKLDSNTDLQTEWDKSTAKQDFAQIVTDRNGNVLRAFPDSKGVWRYHTWVRQVDPDYIQALIAYEDRWFYYHPGVNPLALLRAAWQNWQCQCIVSGGSTLTMQVARLLYPHSRTLTGKLSQAGRAFQLEWHLSKDEILGLYLNYAPMGGVIEGVEAAAQVYLDTTSDDLSLAEAALLVVLPQAPSRLRPDRHPERAKFARDKVIARLLSQERISANDAELALLEPILANPTGVPQQAPLLSRRLIQQYPSKAVIRSTIDADLQRELSQLLSNYVSNLPRRHSGALLVVDNSSGEVLSYLGTADFGSQERWGHVDMVKALRSPGSLMKPFIYGQALDKGIIHGASLLSDAPRLRKDYQPHNFASHFLGPVTPRQALQHSLNLPAVQILEQLGSQAFQANITNAGAEYQVPGDGVANLSQALGGGGIRLEDLVMLYRGLMNQGQTSDLIFELPLESEALQDANTSSTRWLMSPEASWVIADLLRNPLPSHINHSVVDQKNRLAWKTGTSYGFRDAWALGITEDFTMGVWLGRPDSTPSPGYYGAVAALPLLEQVFFMVDRRSTWPAKPAGVSRQSMCWPLGRSQTNTEPEHCHVEKEGWLVREQQPPTLVDQPGVQKQNPLVIALNDKQQAIQIGCGGERIELLKIALWPPNLEPWIAREHRFQYQMPSIAPDCKASIALDRPIQIIGAEPDSHIRVADKQRAPRLTLNSKGGVGTRQWYVNGQYAQSSFTGDAINLTLNRPGAHQIVLIDEHGNSDSVEIWVEL